MIEARISLGVGPGATVGRERIQLLADIAREGSISAGARAAGLTYKAAWDAVAVMSGLVGQRLLTTQTGGKRGGGAVLTPAGLALIEAFGRLEREMIDAVKRIEPVLSGTGLLPLGDAIGDLVRTSARNVWRGSVAALEAGPVTADVDVVIADDLRIRANVTRASIETLGLVVGRQVTVLVKASLIALATTGTDCSSSLNRMSGLVQTVTRDAAQAGAVLDLGQGRSLAATVTADVADHLGLRGGQRVDALIDPAHVLLAIS